MLQKESMSEKNALSVVILSAMSGLVEVRIPKKSFFSVFVCFVCLFLVVVVVLLIVILFPWLVSFYSHC